MKDKLFVGVVGALTGLLLLIPTGFENPSVTRSALFEKAVVLKTDNSDLQAHSIVTTGTQELRLLIRSGPLDGDTVSANNVLLGQKNIDKIFRPGDRVLAVVRPAPSGQNTTGVRAAEYYRQDITWILFACFALFLLAFSKFTGLKILLSFVFTAVCLWKLLIPLYLKGWPPLAVAMGVVISCTAVIQLLVAGLNRKGLSAFLGTVAGVTATALLAMLFGHFFRIPGTVMDYSEALLYSGFTHLNLSEIFISGIFISSAGAVMDVSMDIAASLAELIRHKPGLSRREIIRSGFRIATPVIGSMTTTLLFAYSGSFMFAFMAFMAKGVALQSIVNSAYISAEILHTLVGSFGLVLVAPLTAIIAGYVFTRKRGTS